MLVVLTGPRLIGGAVNHDLATLETIRREGNFVHFAIKSILHDGIQKISACVRCGLYPAVLDEWNCSRSQTALRMCTTEKKCTEQHHF